MYIFQLNTTIIITIAKISKLYHDNLALFFVHSIFITYFFEQESCSTFFVHSYFLDIYHLLLNKKVVPLFFAHIFFLYY
ncbi:hypothetical protein GLOIN_2v1723857, partial [Rhizophagus irregularis DAOM 181602=DAOM 197198]